MRAVNDPNERRQEFCKRCKDLTYHKIIVNVQNGKEKLNCIRCEGLKKNKKYGVAKSKPKGGWTKIKFAYK